MLIIPAIDLKDGQAVRLKKGKMEDATYYSSPLEAAQKWVEAGARRLHLVDLNGAFAAKPVHFEVVEQICANYPKLPIQIGGGIRNLQTIETYLKAGVKSVILGTLAIENKDLVKEACKEFENSIICGIDAKAGKVATRGWDTITQVDAKDLAKEMVDFGVSEIIFTDIERDGVKTGVNLNSTLKLAQALPIPVIASGGVADITDVEKLLALRCDNISGVITGRAIYEGSLDLSQAQSLADSYK